MNLLQSIGRLFTSRRAAVEMPGRPIRARYDAAGDYNETKNIWSGADALDADAANSLGVRDALRKRSRYERANNGYAAGMIATHANYLIGCGPRLRMETASPGMNAMVEARWGEWCRDTRFFSKLRTLARAKTCDGEGLAVLANNPNSPNRVKLDLKPLECDHLTTPLGVGAIPAFNYIDGITFDEFGDPLEYHILTRHPGAAWYAYAKREYATYRAPFVIHWFDAERAGQHRGVPAVTSTLNLFATGRRYREAVVAAAETAADFAAMLEMPATLEGPDEVRPFTSLPIEKRMLVATPAGGAIKQLTAEQPATSYEAFTRSMVCEEARPLNMPYNIAACDSSGYSFSGGRLDHLTYYVGLDVERDECELQVVDKVFAQWFAEATAAYEWTFDATPAPRHSWNWPAKPQIDDQKTASARQTSLACGVGSLSRYYAEDGLDFEDEVAAMAADYGVTVEEIRARLFAVNFARAGAAAPPDPDSSDDSSDESPPAKNGGPTKARAIAQLLASRNGNGAHHDE